MQGNLDVLKVHPHVMRDLRKSGLSEADISDMTPEQAFNSFCNYNGFTGNWGHTFATILDSLRGSRIDTPSIDEVLADPAVSDWAKRTLRTALQRDALDAANDAELVATLLKTRVNALLRAPNT